MLVQGQSTAIAAFRTGLISSAPVLAHFRVTGDEGAVTRVLTDFRVLESDDTAESRVFVPPDYYTCPQCLDELNDPADRRYRYPFIFRIIV